GAGRARGPARQPEVGAGVAERGRRAGGVLREGAGCGPRGDPHADRQGRPGLGRVARLRRHAQGDVRPDRGRAEPGRLRRRPPPSASLKVSALTTVLLAPMALANTRKATDFPASRAVVVISTFRLPVRNDSRGRSFHAALSGVASATCASGRQLARNPASESFAAASATGRGNVLSPSKWIIVGLSGQFGVAAGTVLAFYYGGPVWREFRDLCEYST